MIISERAKQILVSMTLEEKVGQLFVVRCPRENAVQDIGKYHLGGYTLYAVDFENKTPQEVKNDIKGYVDNSKIAPFIAVDEEGGRVVRASKYPQFRKEPFKSPRELYDEGGMEMIASDTVEKCNFLHEYGINFNYAPVCDMASSPDNFIYHRTLGLGCELTAEYACTVVGKMKEGKIIGSVKHFPGYGDNVDTHTSIAHDARRKDEFMNGDILPFARAFDHGAPVVMVAHNIVECIDRDCPASLSAAMHDFLRNELGFDGVIMTDSLDMNAITLYTGDNAAAISAILSGNDLLCCGSYAVQIPAVIDAVGKGIISEERINESVLKLLQLKIDYSII